MSKKRRDGKKGGLVENRPTEPPTDPSVVQGAGVAEVEVLPAEADVVAPLPVEPTTSEASPEDEESGGIVRYDTLAVYLRELRKYPPLTREEEHQLAVQFREQKDVEAAYRLVRGNLWLVVKLAREYERAARSLLDLIQEGNIGLMEAVKNFDPYRGVRFPSYAVWWIRAYIVRYVIANWRLVKIGTTQAQRKLFFNLMREKERLEREGFRPEPKLLAARLDVKESEVVEMEQRLASPDLSVDAPLQDDSDGTLLGMLPSGEATAEDIVGKGQLKQLIAQSFDEFVTGLNEKERTIFRERLLGEEKVTLQDMADTFGVSRERIRQIENRLKERLKKFLIAKFGPQIEQMEIDV